MWEIIVNNSQWLSTLPAADKTLLDNIQKLISNSWGKRKANQYHDSYFIPDKTYWRQKEH